MMEIRNMFFPKQYGRSLYMYNIGNLLLNKEITYGNFILIIIIFDIKSKKRK